jgi:hypothetical protein
MKKMLKIKIGLPVLAVVISIIAGAYSPSSHSAFTGTSYFAQETGNETMLVGQTMPFPPSTNWVNVTTAVNASRSPLQYEQEHCNPGYTRTCFVQVSGFFLRETVAQVFTGEWH